MFSIVYGHYEVAENTTNHLFWVQLGYNLHSEFVCSVTYWCVLGELIGGQQVEEKNVLGVESYSLR